MTFQTLLKLFVAIILYGAVFIFGWFIWHGAIADM